MGKVRRGPNNALSRRVRVNQSSVQTGPSQLSTGTSSAHHQDCDLLGHDRVDARARTIRLSRSSFLLSHTSGHSTHHGQTNVTRALQLQIIQRPPRSPLWRCILHLNHRSKWFRKVKFYGCDIFRAWYKVLPLAIYPP